MHPHGWIPLLGNPLDDNFQNSLSTDNATKSYAPGHAEQHCTALVQYNSVRKELLEIVLVALPSTFPHYNGMLITHPSPSQPIPAVSTAFSATPTIPSKANPDDGESHRAPGRLSPFVADMPREPGKTRQVPRKNQGSEDRRGV